MHRSHWVKRSLSSDSAERQMSQYHFESSWNSRIITYGYFYLRILILGGASSSKLRYWESLNSSSSLSEDEETTSWCLERKPDLVAFCDGYNNEFVFICSRTSISSIANWDYDWWLLKDKFAHLSEGFTVLIIDMSSESDSISSMGTTSLWVIWVNFGSWLLPISLTCPEIKLS